MVRSSTDAEDLFQQTAITMWDKFREFEPGSDFFAWACTIARFKVRDFVKSKARRRVYFSEEVVDKLAATEDTATDEARLQALAKCRQKLSKADQNLLAAPPFNNTIVRILRWPPPGPAATAVGAAMELLAGMAAVFLTQMGPSLNSLQSRVLPLSRKTWLAAKLSARSPLTALLTHN